VTREINRIVSDDLRRAFRRGRIFPINLAIAAINLATSVWWKRLLCRQTIFVVSRVKSVYRKKRCNHTQCGDFHNALRDRLKRLRESRRNRMAALKCSSSFVSSFRVSAMQFSRVESSPRFMGSKFRKTKCFSSQRLLTLALDRLRVFRRISDRE